MGRVFLFAYGTLRDRAVQRRIFGRELAAKPASLAGWRVAARMVRARYPGVARARGASAAGELLALRTGELAVADRYEDVPRLYVRVRVGARSGRRVVRCWMYVPAGQARRGIAAGGVSRLAGGD